jgi:hypothetical protein
MDRRPGNWRQYGALYRLFAEAEPGDPPDSEPAAAAHAPNDNTGVSQPRQRRSRCG